MKLIYVAGKYRGATPWDVEWNIRAAEELGLEVARLGAIPLIVHTQYRFFQGQLPDEFWIEGTLEQMRRCDGAIFLPNWRESTGARGERDECLRLKIEIFDTLSQLDRWLRTDGKVRPGSTE